MDIVTEASAVREFVGERCNVGTFGNARCGGRSEAVNSPLNVGGGSFGFGGGRKDGCFLWSEDRQNVCEVFAVRNSGARISGIKCVGKRHNIKSLLAFSFLEGAEGNKVADAS